MSEATTCSFRPPDFEEDDYPIADYMKVLWNIWEDKYPYPNNYYLTSPNPHLKKVTKPEYLKNWSPKIVLGRLVNWGFIGDLESLFASALALQESEIIDEIVFPELKVELVKLIPLKVSNSKHEYKTTLAVGCDGYLGLAESCHKISRTAIERLLSKQNRRLERLKLEDQKQCFMAQQVLTFSPKHSLDLPHSHLRLSCF